ncbi:hypothetical protein ABZX75_14700 [Streptomyces sp. NPDC003038]|uniref:hypothetical protein n=1 Tax=unclassified Streptomyces TaxID=2593676 RepID=UPI0033BC017C
MTTRADDTTYAQRPPAPLPGTGRRVLRVVAVAATVPYLALKTAWLAGSQIGIPAGSVLSEPGLFYTVANAVTLAMDACVILLVLVLTTPWGIRVPAWLLTVPVFVATGLLTPILIGFSGQLLIRALGFGADPAGSSGQEPFLDPWVFHVVYAGFSVQGLALAGLFVPYARERWGRRWQGVLGERLPSSTGVMAAAAAVTGAAVGAVYLYWAFGGTAGLAEARVEQWSAETGVVSAAHGLCALAAGAGAVLLARGGARRAWWPAALAWTGSAATVSWALWMLIASAGGELETVKEAHAVMYLPYAGQMITGLLSAAVLTRFLTARRSA